MKISIGAVEPMLLTLGGKSGGVAANEVSTSQVVSFLNTRPKRMRKMNLNWKWLIKIRKIK